MHVVRKVSRRRGKGSAENLNDVLDMEASEGGVSYFSRMVAVEKLNSVKTELKMTNENRNSLNINF